MNDKIINMIGQINKTIKYTSCKLNLINDNDDAIYLLEMFIKNKAYLNNFIRNLTFNYDITPHGETKLRRYICNGRNEVTFIKYIHETTNIQDDLYDPSKKSYFCKMNTDIIDKIISKTDLNNIFDDFYLSMMFDKNYYEKIKYKDIYYESDEIIILPVITLFYVSKNVLNKIVNYNKNRYTNDYQDILESLVFNVIIKPDNYDELAKIYESYKLTGNNDTKLYLTKQLLLQKNFSIYHIISANNEKCDSLIYNKFNNIRDQIHKFYQDTLHLSEDMINNINITFNTFHPHNCWPKINVYYRNLYKGHYKYIRLTQYLGSVPYEIFLKCLENCNDLDIYMSSFKEPLINYYDLKNDCYDSQYTIATADIKKGKKIELKTWLTQREKIYRLPVTSNIKNNKINNSFTINKIYNIPYSKYNKICSLSACISFANDPKNYILNIIPHTNEYIKNLGSYDINELNQYLNSDTFLIETLGHNNNDTNNNNNNNANNNNDTNNKKNSSINFYHCRKDNLKYIIEIIQMDCLNCDGKIIKSPCITTQFENHNMTTMNNIYALDIRENAMLAFEYQDFIRNNFHIYIHIIIFNIIHNATNLNIISDVAIKLINLKNKLIANNVIEKDEDTYLENLLEPYTIANINKYIWINDTTYPFIMVADPLYVKYGTDNTFKMLIWYCHQKIMTIEKLYMIIDNIYNVMITKKVKNLSSMILNLDDYCKIFDLDKNIALTDYIFNAASLFDKNGTFINNKYKLDEFIETYRRQQDSYNLFAYFHYHNSSGFETLHIHIVNRNTFSMETPLNRIYEKYNQGPVYNEAMYNINNNYDWLSKLWLKDHVIRIIMDLDDTKNKIKKFKIYGDITDTIKFNLIFDYFINKHYDHDFLIKLYHNNFNTIDNFLKILFEQS